MGLFICFVLPGILVGMLLSQGFGAARRKRASSVKRTPSFKHTAGARAVQSARPQPVKGRLYIHNLQEEYTAKRVA